VQTGSPIRLREADGSVDPAFSLGPTMAYPDAVAVQSDGRILIAGTLAGAFPRALWRLDIGQ
jgi:hypothetical protein